MSARVVDVVLGGIGGFRLGFVDPMFPGLGTFVFGVDPGGWHIAKLNRYR
jgi:hypothetical protein